MFVTWDNLFQFCTVILAVILAVYQMTNKEKQPPNFPQSSGYFSLTHWGSRLLVAPLVSILYPIWGRLSMSPAASAGDFLLPGKPKGWHCRPYNCGGNAADGSTCSSTPTGTCAFIRAQTKYTPALPSLSTITSKKPPSGMSRTAVFFMNCDYASWMDAMTMVTIAAKPSSEMGAPATSRM